MHRGRRAEDPTGTEVRFRGGTWTRVCTVWTWCDLASRASATVDAWCLKQMRDAEAAELAWRRHGGHTVTFRAGTSDRQQGVRYSSRIYLLTYLEDTWHIWRHQRIDIVSCCNLCNRLIFLRGCFGTYRVASVCMLGRWDVVRITFTSIVCVVCICHLWFKKGIYGL